MGLSDHRLNQVNFNYHTSLRPLFIAIIAAVVFCNSLVAQSPSAKNTKKRAKRPVFQKEQWQDVFFEDLFAEGLSGERPATNSSAQPRGDSENDSGSMPTGAKSWSRIIPRDAVENEVKSIQQQLQKLGTSVSRFNTQFRDIQQQFNMLSMMFAIVHEYDTDIRWKKFAVAAQRLFSEASRKSRAPSRAAFEYVKLRKQDLMELVRGGAIAAQKDTSLKWPDVIDRTTVMIRLEKALSEVLKPETANEKQFRKSKDSIQQQAYIVAAIGKVITLKDMDEAEEADYVKYAEDMRQAARELAKAIEIDDFQVVIESVNRIEQSCNDCHGDWR